jgi:maltooligosyltrehalose trehalohydrolase
MGDRLAAIVSVEKVRVAAAAIVLSPFLPMLFMGEEYGETAPFQYFTSHGDPDLIEAVRKGRLEEFDDFDWLGDPPDPHAEDTFLRSKLNWSLDGSIRRLYKKLLALRRDTPALRTLDLTSLETYADDARRILLVRRWTEADQALVAFNFDEKAHTIDIPFITTDWRALIDTGAKIEENRITLPPVSFALFSGNPLPESP